eukprot:610857-Pelagomonas_calceolata.AAC.1
MHSSHSPPKRSISRNHASTTRPCNEHLIPLRTNRAETFAQKQAGLAAYLPCCVMKIKTNSGQFKATNNGAVYFGQACDEFPFPMNGVSWGRLSKDNTFSEERGKTMSGVAPGTTHSLSCL